MIVHRPIKTRDRGNNGPLLTDGATEPTTVCSVPICRQEVLATGRIPVILLSLTRGLELLPVGVPFSPSCAWAHFSTQGTESI
jgi:hypothetical protein